MTSVSRAVDVYLDGLAAAREDSSTPRLLVAFSGGPDSLALLAALLASGRTTVHAAHLDHGLDAGSSARAGEAVALAGRLGLGADRIHVERAEPPASPPDGLEAWARRVRYECLHRVADDVGCERILTAHHADDQAETVLLRLLHGSGLEGLAGIRPRHGRVDRPLLHPFHPLDGVRRREIESFLEALRLDDPALLPLRDPTNRDPGQSRARVRHRLLPYLQDDAPDLPCRLRSLGRASRGLRRRLDAFFEAHLETSELRWGGIAVEARAFLGLPGVLRHHALTYLHRRAGLHYPASAAAEHELARQIDAGGEVAVDCGDGWSWRLRRELLRLQPSANPPPPFTYTRRGPGTIPVPELDLSIRFAPAAVEPWMFRGARWRAGLHLSHAARPQISIRTRRPGDRLEPLGRGGHRSVKDLLIDRRVPRHARDRLPLLFVDGILAWVPGVTVDERFRLPADGPAWVAEIQRASDDEASHDSDPPTRTPQR